jgi:hypothetical protein
MQKKLSGHGLKVVEFQQRRQEDARDLKGYGIRPWPTLAIQPMFPYDNWLIYQATSIKGKLCTLDEAKDLFKVIDPNTRLPYVTVKLPWYRRLSWARTKLTM